MITFQVEKVKDILDEVKPLLEAHYHEIATHTRGVNPNYEQYLKLCDLGMLRIVTSRDDDVLIGYFITLVMNHLHYQHMVYALNDIVYIDHGYRGTTVAYRLFKHAIDDLKQNCNADIIQISMKTKYEFRNLLTKLKFTQIEENWEMQI